MHQDLTSDPWSRSWSRTRRNLGERLDCGRRNRRSQTRVKRLNTIGRPWTFSRGRNRSNNSSFRGPSPVCELSSSSTRLPWSGELSQPARSAGSAVRAASSSPAKPGRSGAFAWPTGGPDVADIPESLTSKPGTDACGPLVAHSPPACHSADHRPSLGRLGRSPRQTGRVAR